MKALVTGGGGFLGKAVVRKLRQRDWDVRSFSRGAHPALEALGVESFRGDLGRRQDVERACDGCDIIFHVAAKADLWGPYPDFYRANVIGTENILEAARRRGIARVVFTSSPSAVFSGRDMEGVDESVPYPAHYKSPYPETKAKAEKLVREANSPTLATVALRPHLIWGPGDTHLVPGILARGRGFKRIGTGAKLVDFTFIEDAAEAHLLAADALQSGSAAAGNAYFISQGEPMDLWEFINRVLEIGALPRISSSVSPRVAYAAGAMLEFLHKLLRIKREPRVTRFLVEELSTAHWFDISAARRDLNYRPSVTMEEGFALLKASMLNPAAQLL
jgi:nucleoside-diphosphate-sugar epimerase